MLKILKKDWFAALLISLVLLLFGNSAVIEKLELSSYDFAMRHSVKDPGKDINVIAIDDRSIENIGRWPWPRSIQAELIEKLANSGADVVGYSILLSEEQTNPASEYINRALSQLKSNGDIELNSIIKTLEEGNTKLDTDNRLSTAIKNADNVVLGMQFNLGVPNGNPDGALPEYVTNNTIDNSASGAAEIYFVQADNAVSPIEKLGSQSEAIGHLSLLQDIDGGVRTELLVVDYFGQLFPSIATMIAASSLNLKSNELSITPNRNFNLGNLSIAMDSVGRFYPYFYLNDEGKTPFRVESFYDVYHNNIDPETFKNKIVLIGPTAFGLGTSTVTPVSESMAPVVVLANVVASLLNQHFIVAPDWAWLVEFTIFIIIALYLMLVLPRLSASLAAIMSSVVLIVLLGSSQFLLLSGMWFKFMLPITLLITGYLLLISKRYLITEKGKILSDKESADSNRILGLSYQQQGQLDMALDKFRKCPLDDSMMEPFYNLALDFERKRQFNKASSVYEYMSRHDDNFKDIKERMKKSQAMQDTFVFGAAGVNATNNLLSDGTIEKPMLGRYQIEKELGKGAMGVVYLGKDPKINRVVAIKTLALSQEFEDSELDEIKERFFREAETAGRLTHPNIVTVYDVGEEHDLAYIAMEYLEGHDLSKYTKPDKLLPVKNAIQIIILAAEALSYAHQQNIVHRDIKPANIMFIPKSSTIKLTDFGIARITDSSKTKTGMVLGTPSYMSPEQLVGKHIDGRSDLFSLGVMLFQLLTGRLPFKGDSMASLMFCIANEKHPEITGLRKELKPLGQEMSNILDKLLEKTPQARYQTGEELAKELRKCLKMFKKK